MSFQPEFTITPRIAQVLMRIEAARQAVLHLPITSSVMAALRETARLYSTHYSTMIEGNRLAQEEVSKVIEKYEALTVGPSHNYYLGRVEADITNWLRYFCEGMSESFESVKKHAQEAASIGAKDRSILLRRLDPRQRKALELFRHSDTITSRDIEGLFNLSQRAARNILTAWVQDGFLIVTDPARKSRKYGLAKEYWDLLE